jgi:chromate transport protein ChrA
MTTVSFAEALRVWTRVALNSFGGPTGQIAVMHRILVDEKRWISEERFLHALSYCMLLPGPRRSSSPPTWAGCSTARAADSPPASCSCCRAS